MSIEAEIVKDKIINDICNQLDKVKQILNKDDEKNISNPSRKINYLYNRIISGAPGTGKSSKLKNDSESMEFNEVKRVTFYPTYRYSQFIGSYKPSPIYSCPKEESNIVDNLYKSDYVTEINPYRKPIIDYKLVPGPFLDILCKALKNLDKKYLLIIEEINRGDAASIFGDTFQLLDRNDKGVSKYGITFNEDIMSYLRGEEINLAEIKIPSNMYIWCTMNSADEGVKKLDSAFKRRWSFEYMHLNGEKDAKTQQYINSLKLKTRFKCLKDKGLSGEIYWNQLREKINEMLLDTFNIPEDKLIGPFFLSNEELKDEDTLIEKLVMYLKEDVLRYKANEFFGENSFFKLYDLYKEKGENIFSSKISDDEIISMKVKLEDNEENRTKETELESNDKSEVEGELNYLNDIDLNSGDLDNE